MFNVAPVVAIWLAWFFVAANVVGTKFATPYAASTLFMLHRGRRLFHSVPSKNRRVENITGQKSLAPMFINGHFRHGFTHDVFYVGP